MIITVNKFEGVSPKVADRLLDNNQATLSLNCDLRNGNLNPLKDVTTSRTVELGTQTIHKFTNSDFWLQWTTDVDCLRGPLPNDTESRTYFTGDGPPKMTYAGLVSAGSEPYPTNSYLLGVPAPETAPAATPTGASSSENAIPTSRVYIYTYVTEKGEEGPPSPPSAVVDWLPGQSVDVSLMTPIPSGNYNVTRKRLYRYAQGGTSGGYLFVAEVDDATTSYIDTIEDIDLPGGLLVTTDYDPPPEDMIGLTMLSNGIMAGFSGREICFSEPYLPYAWPVKYRKTVDYDVVALGAMGNGLVVTTKGQPYIMAGSHPEAMSQDRLDMDQACVSKRSVVSDGSGVIFASPDGLIMASLSGSENITKELMTREQWQSLKPESILGVIDEGRYIGFYDNGSEQGSFIIDPQNPSATLSFTSVHANAVFRDKLTDQLYLVQNDQLVAWDGEATLEYKWKSKLFITEVLSNFSSLRVFADKPVMVKVWGENVLRYASTLSPGAIARLPSGYMARRWQIELQGDAEIEQMDMATNVMELR